MADDSQRMKELTELLNRASEAYYAKDTEIMSNFEYDRLYDELAALEQKTGITLANSPTVHVGYEAAAELPKERHEKPMLSLGKTKDREELKNWIGSHEGLLSWKLDGLTVVLTYRDGKLFKAVTRGNGEIGEVITPNARVFRNIPLSIPYKEELILRGEAVIRYSDFERINRQIEEEAAKSGTAPDMQYKNPRNLCSGSVRQLNNQITAERCVNLFAFTLVKADGVDFGNSRERQLLWLAGLGFETVFYVRVTAENILQEIASFEKKIEHYDVPSDGLVLTFDDIAYGRSLGMTAKFPRDSIAFKWQDELQETSLLRVEWSASRTGLINPVAVFEPVELEGTTVRRASVHNVSILRSLKLGIGDRIRVYKANMIIPQIAENLTGSGNVPIPETCPACGASTEVRRDNDAEVLVCTNPDCPAKKLKSFVLFTSRNAMNIEGLSEMTLEKFIGCGFIQEYADIYHLGRFRKEIEEMEGFGAKSAENLEAGIEKSRSTTLARLIYALGIPGIGAANARVLAQHFGESIDALLAASKEELSEAEGVGDVLADAITGWFADAANQRILQDLLREITIAAPEKAGDRPQPLAGKTFVITGEVHHFANRDELKEQIIRLGGKATGSVTKKTDYLINNDTGSGSTKNRTAKQLGVPVISEEEFLKLCSDAVSEKQ